MVSSGRVRARRLQSRAVSTMHAPPSGARAATEPRGRGGGARSDAALRDRDRRGDRDPRRVAVLPRLARDDLPRDARPLGRRASPSTRSRSRTSSRSEASSTGSAAAARVAELAALVSATAATSSTTRRIVKETATLRGLIHAGQEIARLGRERIGETAELVDRAEQIVFDLSQQRIRGDFDAHRAAPHRELRADHEALRGRRGRHRHPVRLPRPRPAHVGASSRATS